MVRATRLGADAGDVHRPHRDDFRRVPQGTQSAGVVVGQSWGQLQQLSKIQPQTRSADNLEGQQPQFRLREEPEKPHERPAAEIALQHPRQVRRRDDTGDGYCATRLFGTNPPASPPASATGSPSISRNCSSSRNRATTTSSNNSSRMRPRPRRGTNGDSTSPEPKTPSIAANTAHPAGLRR